MNSKIKNIIINERQKMFLPIDKKNNNLILINKNLNDFVPYLSNQDKEIFYNSNIKFNVFDIS